MTLISIKILVIIFETINTMNLLIFLKIILIPIALNALKIME